MCSRELAPYLRPSGYDGDVCPHTNFSQATLLYDGSPRLREFGHKYREEPRDVSISELST